VHWRRGEVPAGAPAAPPAFERKIGADVIDPRRRVIALGKLGPALTRPNAGLLRDVLGVRAVTEKAVRNAVGRGVQLGIGRDELVGDLGDRTGRPVISLAIAVNG